MKPTIISIIPARGGSKGVPGKNIKLIAGKPLIAYSIEQSLNSKSISRTIVSTDNDEIAAVAKEYGAEVIKRPDELAKDTSALEPSLVHVLEQLKKEGTSPDYFVLLQPTSPVRGSNEIDDAIKKVVDEKADSSVSAARSHFFLWKEEKGAAVSVNHDSKELRKRRQDLEPEYVENGSIYVMKVPEFMECGNRFFGKTVIFEMSDENSYQIDTSLDVEVITKILQRKKDESTIKRFAKIKLLVFDFDGVITDNKVVLTSDGKEKIVVDRSDGHGVITFNAQKFTDIKAMVLTKEKSIATQLRCKKLSLELVDGISDKLPVLKNIVKKMSITPEEVCYVGNDTNDLECVQYAGLGIAVNDSHKELLKVADIVTEKKGGQGAVREVMDLVIASRKKSSKN